MSHRKRALIAVCCRKCFCTQRTAYRKDFVLILKVKMETRHPVGKPFHREFSAFVIIAEL